MTTFVSLPHTASAAKVNLKVWKVKENEEHDTPLQLHYAHCNILCRDKIFILYLIAGPCDITLVPILTYLLDT